MPPRLLREAQVSGGDTLCHNAVPVPATGVVTRILPARKIRRRVTLFNNGASGSVCYVGAVVNAIGLPIAPANGFPLSSSTVEAFNPNGDLCYFKVPGYVLVLYTKAAIYGVVVNGGVAADIRYLEEVD